MNLIAIGIIGAVAACGLFSIGVIVGVRIVLKRIEAEEQRVYDKEFPGVGDSRETTLWAGEVAGLRQAARMCGSRKFFG